MNKTDDSQSALFAENAEKYTAPLRLAGSGKVSYEHTVETKQLIISELLQIVIGERIDREGLLETPKRVVKAWAEWTAGYGMVPAEILKTFEDGAEGATEMVIVKDIPFYSHCEHHMAPFFGSVTIGYVPNGKIVGLSKLGRLSDVFAKRLQVQERYTNQIADALQEHLQPKFIGVVAKARHMCMESRGIQRSGGQTSTQAFRYAGELEDPMYLQLRKEFLALAV